MRISPLRMALVSIAFAAAASAPAAAQRGDRTRETVYDQSFNVSAGDRLVVDVGDMDVRVESGSAARIHVIAWAKDHAFARDIYEEMRFSAGASGGTLTIETDEPRNWSYDWQEWQRRGGASFTAIVTVPERFDLDLKTGDGDVTVGSFNGAVAVNTGDGDVRLESVSGPEIRLRTGDGDVTAESLDAPTISLDTGDGDLIVRQASGAVTASSGDGDIRIEVGRYEGLSIRTGDGDVTVFADPSIRANVDVNGEDLSMGRSFTLSGRIEEDRLSGTLNGGGPELRIRTGDGSVSIRGR